MGQTSPWQHPRDRFPHLTFRKLILLFMLFFLFHHSTCCLSLHSTILVYFQLYLYTYYIVLPLKKKEKYPELLLA